MAASVAAAFSLLFPALNAFAGKIQYTHDAAGRLVAEDYGAGRQTDYAYDKNGNLLAETTTVATDADVRLIKTASIASVPAGEPFTYTLTVSNSGPAAATSVVVSDPLPFGILSSGVSASQGSVSISNHTVIGDLGMLNPNTSATVTITVFHGLTNIATNMATVAAGSPDPNPTNNEASVSTTGLPPPDSDNDGLPDWWEQLHGLNHMSDSDDDGADGDLDHDGVSNEDEFIADTLADDENSIFEIASQIFEAGAGEFTLTIDSSPIRRYVLEFTDDLSQPFTPVETVNGTGGPITFSHTGGASFGYYRVRVEIP